MGENILNNLTVQELLRYVDRSHREVKALAEALEVEIENNSPDGTLDEIANPKALVNNEGDIERVGLHGRRLYYDKDYKGEDKPVDEAKPQGVRDCNICGLPNTPPHIECGCNNGDDLSIGGEKPRSGWREDDEYRGG